MDKVLILDFGSQVTQLIARRIRKKGVYCEIYPYNKSKKEMIATIAETFDTTIHFIANLDLDILDERLDYFGANRTKRQILLLLADHITHHRAQMLVNMRLNKIQPPRYVLYQ